MSELRKRKAHDDDSHLLKPEHARRFRRLAKSMEKLILEVRRYVPEANMYLEDSGNWHLLSGDSHDSSAIRNMVMRQDRSMVREDCQHSGGGAW